MNDFDELLDSDSVAFGVRAASKKALFRELARRAADLLDADASIIERELGERERLGSTGFGDGVAIPHCQIEGIGESRGLFLRLAEPVDYDSVDELPVDCVFALFSPRDSGAEHLRALARVSRLLRDARFVAKLRGARSEDALYALLTRFEAADAA